MTRAQLVSQVIELAARIGAYWDVELPKRHPDYPLVHEGEEDGPPPPEEEQLRELLRSRPDEDVYFLSALMHLGMQDFAAARIGGETERLARFAGGPTPVVDRLLAKVTLADDLADGLRALRAAGIDPENVRVRLAA